MAKIINSQSGQNAGQSRFKISQKTVVLALIILAVVAAVIIYAANNKSASTGSQANQADSLNLVSYKYTGDQPGTGVVFQKPYQFTETSASRDKLIKSFDWSNGGHIDGSIRVLSAPFSDDSEKQAATNGLQALARNNSNDRAYQSAAQPVVLLSRSWLAGVNSKYITDLKTAQAFRTSDFGNDAWQFPLSASAPKKDNLPKMRGVFLYIVGKNAAYFFGIASTNQKWQSDSATWQQILNSIKIDQ